MESNHCSKTFSDSGVNLNRDLKKYVNIIFVLILFISSCSEKPSTEANISPLRIIQNESSLVERYGLWYEINSNVPFTGVLRVYKNNIYNSNKKLVSKKTFKDGKYDGEHLNYHNNGQLAARINYRNGIYHGEYLNYHNNGQLAERKNYKNGVYHGEQTSFYNNGAIKNRISYKFGKYEGINESFQINGQSIKTERYSANKKDGMQEYFFNSGQLNKRERYSAGKKNGQQESFYPEGQQLSNLENYKDGKLHGKYEKFFPDGRSMLRTTYKNDIQNGLREEYDASGALKYTTSFVDGKRHGISKTYFKGTLKTLYTYNNDKLHGENREYDSKGNFKRYVYEHGYMISTDFFLYNRTINWYADREKDIISYTAFKKRRNEVANRCEKTSSNKLNPPIRSSCIWSDEEYKDWVSFHNFAQYDAKS